MYEQFYGFTEKPFNTVPDPKFFFPSSKHAEALNSLIYATNERKGFVVITGEIGAGKTTVCRTLLNKLELNTKCAIITNTHLTPKELISEILEEFEVDYKEGTKQKLLAQLNNFLIKQLASDVNIVLIIDEAQNLSPKVLEEVRMLSNLETEKEKLIQIILLGQPQLREKLADMRLAQFKQRVAVYYHLAALNKEETEEYILHRLKLVGTNGVANIFDAQALNLIYKNSCGIPRLINLICDSALLSGYIYETKTISEKIINEVIKERDFRSQPEEINPDTESNKQQGFSPKGTVPEITIYCCTACHNYMTCGTKWVRGIKGQEQLCCRSCQDYARCVENINEKEIKNGKNN